MKKTLLAFFSLICLSSVAAPKAPFMTNAYNRESVRSLNGKWDAIIDMYDLGNKRQLFLNKKAEKGSEFYEYSWEGGYRLNVPGDWNFQMPQLEYYEGTVWYARHIDFKPNLDERQFLYFAAVSYRCNVYLNGQKIASHEGSFTPFQIEVGDILREGDNFLCVEVSNRRTVDAIPAMSYDWWSYGGITRDVLLISTPKVYIHDYSLALDRNDPSKMNVSVTLSDASAQEVVMDILDRRRIRYFW